MKINQKEHLRDVEQIAKKYVYSYIYYSYRYIYICTHYDIGTFEL